MWNFMTRKDVAGVAGALFLAMGLVVLPAFGAEANEDSAGHAIADKFAGTGEAEAKRKAGEAKARAAAKARKSAEDKAKAEVRAADAERLRQEAAARAGAERRAAAERAAAVEAARTAAAERARAEETEMLARARAESEREEARRKLEEEWAEAARQRSQAEERARERANVEKARSEAEAAEKARQEVAGDARRAEERRQREAEEQRVETERQAMAAEREAEARRLAEKHNRLREEREMGASRSGIGAEPDTVVREEAPWARSGPREGRFEHEDQPERRPPPFPVGHAGRATILLVMEPGRRGIRRFDHSAEPIVCTGSTCYISTGPGYVASPMPRMAALGPANTFGRRAGACRHTLTCVFRRVDVGARAQLEPIDLRVLRHDRRGPAEVRPDTSCHVDMGRLACANTVRAGSWRAWIVPEDVAREAGPALLEAAVRAGLPDGRSAAR